MIEQMKDRKSRVRTVPDSKPRATIRGTKAFVSYNPKQFAKVCVLVFLGTVLLGVLSGAPIGNTLGGALGVLLVFALPPILFALPRTIKAAFTKEKSEPIPQGFAGISQQSKANGRVQKAVSAVSFLVEMQLKLGGLETGGRDLHLAHPYPMGYIYGLCDGVCQVMKLSEFEGLTAMSLAFADFYGREKGPRVFRFCAEQLQKQDTPEFLSGVSDGGQEAFAYLNERTVPSRLSSRLLR